jgi:hypothetical protein
MIFKLLLIPIVGLIGLGLIVFGASIVTLLVAAGFIIFLLKRII